MTSVSFLELLVSTVLPGCETVRRSFLVLPTLERRSLTFLEKVHFAGALKRSFAFRWAITRLPFLIRSVTLFSHAAAVAPAGSVIVPFMVTRMYRPLIFAESTLPGPVKETGSTGADAFSIVTLADAVPVLPALSAKLTVTDAK